MAADEHGSPSPQPLQPMTKRDQRRTKIMDKLEGVIASFNANQQDHYRAQLLAIQADMTLILRADPYTNVVDDGSTKGSGGEDATAGDGGESKDDVAMLDDSGDAIQEKILQLGTQLPEDEEAQRNYWSIAGNAYRKFAQSVNDSIEERDADMTALHNRYEASLCELDRLTQQKLHQADEEHKNLANTIRARLIATISKKRNALLRDKEQLDIADSNALLLHPSHYSINNPGSPGGGALANRKTRHLRHRAASPSVNDLGGSGAGGGGATSTSAGGAAENKRNKRKYNQIEDGDGNESPAPGGIGLSLRNLDALGGGRSPFKDARDKNAYAQYEAPAYSLERIFTDKELALATDTAKTATFRYFHTLQGQQQQKSDEANNGTNGAPSLDGEAGEPAFTAEDAVAAAAGAAADTPPPGIEMARETSHQVLTRNSARANPLAALSDLAVAAASASAAGGGSGGSVVGGYGGSSDIGGVGIIADPFAPQFPPWHAVTRPEKSSAPGPASMSAMDVEADFSLMRRTGAHGAVRRGLDGVDAGGVLGDGSLLVEPLEAAGGGRRGSADAEAASTMRRQLLAQALDTATLTSTPYRLPLLETGPAIVGKGVDRPAATAFTPALSVEQRLKLQQQQAAATAAATAAASSGGGGGGGSMAAALHGRFGGEAMSRTTSAGGASEIGGPAGGSEVGVGVAASGGRRGRGRLV